MKKILMAAAAASVFGLPAYAQMGSETTCTSFTAMSSADQMAVLHDAMSPDQMASGDKMASGDAMASDHMASGDKMASGDAMSSDQMAPGDKMASGDAMSTQSTAMKVADMCKTHPQSTVGAILKTLH